MESIQVGDFVRTQAGENGTVVFVHHRTAWVFLNRKGSDPQGDPFPASTLTAAAPPTSEK